jgi:PKD repeat protein
MYTPSAKRISPRNHPPTADATAGEPYVGFVYEVLTFDGSRSYDRDGRIIAWRWSYGDGATGTGETTTHAYNHSGDFTVTLTVTDNWYASDVYTTTARITPGNNPASTPIVTGPHTGRANVSYDYTMVATDPDGDFLQYVIDWGDGSIKTSPMFLSGHQISTMHQWQRLGFYTMQVYTWDQFHAMSTVSETVIAIDVHYVGNLGYLIDADSDGAFDRFYSNITGHETKATLVDSGKYLIDVDGDGRWDTIYDPLSDQYQEYTEVPLLDYVIFAVLVISFVLILYLGRKKGRSITLTSKK